MLWSLQWQCEWRYFFLWESYGGQCNCGARKQLYQWKVVTCGTGWKKHIFFVIKPTRCTNFTNLFWHENLHVSDSSSVDHQEFIHCTLSNGISHTSLAFEQDQSSILVLLESCPETGMTYTTAEYTVNKLLMMDRGTVRNRVSCQNKFVKLVHLDCFITKKFVMMHAHMNVKNTFS
jgi:hypothetical protein